jgi:hypothetical protein
LQSDLREATEIREKLSELKLFKSFSDQMTQYTNLARFINETGPGKLSKKGQHFLSNDRSGD